jgi:hypothetical protein
MYIYCNNAYNVFELRFAKVFALHTGTVQTCTRIRFQPLIRFVFYHTKNIRLVGQPEHVASKTIVAVLEHDFSAKPGNDREAVQVNHKFSVKRLVEMIILF